MGEHPATVPQTLVEGAVGVVLQTRAALVTVELAVPVS
jgi:hypothetical protein